MRSARVGRGLPLENRARLIAAYRKVRARVEHVIGRMKNYKILRDCRQRGDAPTTPSKPSPTCTTSPSHHDQKTAITGSGLPEHGLVQHP